jgi:hypothetical protein
MESRTLVILLLIAFNFCQPAQANESCKGDKLIAETSKLRPTGTITIEGDILTVATGSYDVHVSAVYVCTTAGSILYTLGGCSQSQCDYNLSDERVPHGTYLIKVQPVGGNLFSDTVEY